MVRNVGIVIFDDVEVLDFAGPFEVFGVAKDEKGQKIMQVFLLSENKGLISARNNFRVAANYTLHNSPKLDILLIPGGYGTRIEMHNETLRNWIMEQFQDLELLLSVCTGSLILGKCGLLNNRSATTHHGAFDELREAAPDATVITDQKYVDNGKIITSAGISAGITMSLYVIQRLYGKQTAINTSKYMEYDWMPV